MENELNKMTAVEWLFKQVWLTPISELPKLLEQAKQMEKEQIIDAWEDGVRSDNGFFGTFEQYYNEEYGGNK